MGKNALPTCTNVTLQKGTLPSMPRLREKYIGQYLPCLFWELLNVGIQAGSDAITQKWRQYLQSAYILQESSGRCHRLILTELPYQSRSVGRNQLEDMDSPTEDQPGATNVYKAHNRYSHDFCLTWIKMQRVSCSENWYHILLGLCPLTALPLLSLSLQHAQYPYILKAMPLSYLFLVLKMY